MRSGIRHKDSSKALFNQQYQRDERLSVLPNVQRLSSTLVMKQVIQDRALAL